MGLPYDPAVPLLPIQEKTCLHKPCTHMFIALFIRAKNGSNPDVHQMVDNNQKVVYPYSGILLGNKKLSTDT